MSDAPRVVTSPTYDKYRDAGYLELWDQGELVGYVKVRVLRYRTTSPGSARGREEIDHLEWTVLEFDVPQSEWDATEASVTAPTPPPWEPEMRYREAGRRPYDVRFPERRDVTIPRRLGISDEWWNS